MINKTLTDQNNVPVCSKGFVLYQFINMCEKS